MTLVHFLYVWLTRQCGTLDVIIRAYIHGTVHLGRSANAYVNNALSWDAQMQNLGSTVRKMPRSRGKRALSKFVDGDETLQQKFLRVLLIAVRRIGHNLLQKTYLKLAEIWDLATCAEFTRNNKYIDA